MEKNIKDYLPFYIGAMAEISNLSQRMIVYGFEDGIIKINGYLIDALDKEDSFTIKPILRPLSSMTEVEDQIEFRKHNRGHFIDQHWFPEGFQWLLSKHFDLFGLIEAGLAIEKKS
jgi:hypothetical protein